jgi:hypothetical protein
MPYDGEVRIYDISGRKVYETNASFTAGNCEMLFMDANINRGFFILQVFIVQKKRILTKILCTISPGMNFKFLAVISYLKGYFLDSKSG